MTDGEERETRTELWTAGGALWTTVDNCGWAEDVPVGLPSLPSGWQGKQRNRGRQGGLEVGVIEKTVRGK